MKQFHRGDLVMMIARVIEAVPPGSKGIVLVLDTETARFRTLHSYKQMASVRVYWLTTHEAYWVLAEDIQRINV